MLRGVCEIPCPGHFIVDFIRDYRNKPRFDKNIDLAEMLYEVDDNLKIVYNKINTPPIISTRDAVFVQGMRDVGETTYIASKSI